MKITWISLAIARILLALLLCTYASEAFFMYKVVMAALLANSLGGRSYLPIPIPIPIPIKAGGNTIIAVPSKNHEMLNIGGGDCGGKPCFDGQYYGNLIGGIQ